MSSDALRSVVAPPDATAPRARPVAIASRGLCAGPGGRDVLQGVDVAVAAGAWTAVVGPNGAGKTTLVKSLAMLLASRGALDWNGRDARAMSVRRRARELAWLGQGETGAEDLLAHDVVRLGRLPHVAWLASPSAADEAAVEAAMRDTQCWDWRKRPLGELSGGERQRVLLARALAVQAPMLVMDEPLASLDPPHQADWLAIVRRHVRRGGTVVSVLHELTMALQADFVVVVEAGRIAFQGAAGDRACAEAVERVFARRVQVRTVDGRRVVLPSDEVLA